MIKLLIPAFLLVSVGFANAQSTGRADTKGLCSPANTGNNNTFTINCGIGREQGEKLLAIMNKILAKQTDLSEVMAKLDEIVNKLRWELSPSQVARLVEALKTGRRGPVAFTCSFGDGEACAIARQLDKLFADAGWPAGEGIAQVGDRNRDAASGIVIVFANRSRLPAHMLTIEAAFKSAGIPIAQHAEDGSVHAEYIEVFVGHRPGAD
jgi:hypothetical protein